MYFPSFFLDQKELKDANLLYTIEYSLKSHLINFSKFFTDKIHAEQKRKKKKKENGHTQVLQYHASNMESKKIYAEDAKSLVW